MLLHIYYLGQTVLPIYRRKKAKDILVNQGKVSIYASKCHKNRGHRRKKTVLRDKMAQKKEGGHKPSLFVTIVPKKIYQKFFYYFILYNRTLNNIILRIIFRISNNILYIYII